MPIDLHVSLVGRRHLTREIYRQLRTAILDGRLRPGERLPATRELAQRLAVARTTIMDVYDRLLSEGFIESHVGRGTFVASDLRPRPYRESPPSGVLRARPIWETIPEPTALRRSFEFDFRTGVPDIRAFPFDVWRRLHAREWHRAAVGRGGYGEPAGDPTLREAIVEHVAVSRGVRATRGNVVVTSGTQQAIDVVARALISPGEVVAVEDPGYRVALHPAVERSAGRGRAGRRGRDPGGRHPGRGASGVGDTVPPVPARDGDVAATAPGAPRLGDEHDAAIVEDDYDSEFRLSGRPIEPLQMLDDAGRVIYVGTFSKSMLPTLRLGFVVVPDSIRPAVETAKYVADWHSPVATQRALAVFIRDGEFARHVRRMRAIYRERHDRITTFLRRELADEVRVVRATAGVHLATLSTKRSIAEIDEVIGRAATVGVGLQGTAAMAADHEPRPGLLFGYGGIATEHIEEGLARLRASFDD